MTPSSLRCLPGLSTALLSTMFLAAACAALVDPPSARAEAAAAASSAASAVSAAPTPAAAAESPASPLLAPRLSESLPFLLPSPGDLHRSPRKVFAHYFTPFPLSIDNKRPEEDYYATQYLKAEGEHGKFRDAGGYLRERPLGRAPSPEADWEYRNGLEEVQLASAIGLDGFSLDLLSTQGYNWTRSLGLLRAAEASGTGFKILLMPDMRSEFRGHPERLLPTLRILLKEPGVYRLADGRAVISPYAADEQPPSWWNDLMATLKKEGTPIALLPVIQGWQRHVRDYAPLSIGISDWGVRSAGANRAWAAAAAQAHDEGLLWMAPASPQDLRPKSQMFWEARNSENYRTMWMNAIQGRADWVQVITWNDYSESTEINPSSRTQWSFYDLTAYYTAWFKMGRAPAITRDAIFYFYRQSAAGDAPSSAPSFRRPAGSDAVSDDIEALVFATAPAEVEISVSEVTRRQRVGAGMTSVRMPSLPGRPAFRLRRQDQIVASVQGAFVITAHPDGPDLLYCGGSSLRPPVTP